MCGIAGFCNYEGDFRPVIREMKEQIISRGPDGQGEWHCKQDNVTLGHCRLAIIDLSDNAAQPMISQNGRYVLIYNGEIYNCNEVINKFGIRKEKLRSTSDTEVLLEAISQSNIKKVLEKCRGMYALALYDREKKSLYLARDRMGEKPLYYGWINGCLVFASDLKALKAFPKFRGEVNKEALSVFLRLSYIPAPLTIFEGIYKLEPGCIAEVIYPFRKENILIDKYWTLSEIALRGLANPFKGSFEEAVEELKCKMKNVIHTQMAADVPVGAFLSGGIDSASVAAVLQALSTNPIETFTIGVKDEIDEAPRAKMISEYLGTRHNELYVNENDCLNVIPKLSDIYSEPFGDPTAIPTRIVSELARSKVTVSLSGDGGDELFCGYTLYKSVNHNINNFGKIPYNIRKAVATPFDNYINKKKGAVGYYISSKDPCEMAERYVTGMRVAEKLVNGVNNLSCFYRCRNIPQNLDILSQLMLMDQLLFLPDSHMVKMDRAAMSVSLESRTPFLDKDLVEFAWSLPIEYKYFNGVQKKVLREMAYQYIPQSLLEMPKRGFSIPLYKWLKNGRLSEWAADLLNISKLQKEGFLNLSAVEKIWNIYLKTNGNYGWRQIWNILIFENWLEKK